MAFSNNGHTHAGARVCVCVFPLFENAIRVFTFLNKPLLLTGKSCL